MCALSGFTLDARVNQTSYTRYWRRKRIIAHGTAPTVSMVPGTLEYNSA